MDKFANDMILWHTRIDPEGTYAVIKFECKPTGEQFVRTDQGVPLAYELCGANGLSRRRSPQQSQQEKEN